MNTQIKTESIKKEPLRLSKYYRLGNMKHPEFGGLVVAKSLFNSFVQEWRKGNHIEIYKLLNDGFRGTAYIRLRKQEGQQTSDAEQIFYAWLDEVETNVRAEITKAHKEQKQAFLEDTTSQMFPAREIMFGTCDPELEEVENDSESEDYRN